jgi:hypothetical protein
VTRSILLRFDKTAAQRYFEKSIDQNVEPETATIDKSGANLAALEAINADCETPIKVLSSLSKQNRLFLFDEPLRTAFKKIVALTGITRRSLCIPRLHPRRQNHLFMIDEPLRTAFEKIVALPGITRRSLCIPRLHRP